MRTTLTLDPDVAEALAQPYVTILDLGARHAEIPLGLLESIGTAGDLTTDAHLAALAIEYQAELHSTDADFTRFPGVALERSTGLILREHKTRHARRIFPPLSGHTTMRHGMNLRPELANA